MFEFLLIFVLVYLFLLRKKRKRKPRGLDGELKELITQSSDATSVGLDIKRYLLNTINENNNDREKFSDAQIAEAQRILDRAGPAAFYWMSDIAAQLAVLAAAQANGLPTNVGEKLGDRVPDRNIAQLTVVKNESYRDFADSLQKEYAESGVSIGMVRQAESLTEEWLQDSIIG